MALNIIIIFLLISCCTYSVTSLDNPIWYSYQFGSGFGNREELVITKVEAVEDFKPNEHVIKWKSLSMRHKSYAIGLTVDGITALQAVVDDNKNGSLNINSTYTPMNGTILDAALLEHKSNEIISIIAYNNLEGLIDISWYKIADNNKLINLWKLKDYKKNISHLNSFKIDDKNFVLIFTDQKENYTTADLYEFNLNNTSKFWFVQSFEFDVHTNSSTINTYGSNTYLSFPVENKVIVFKYENNHFVQFKDLTARHVRYVTSFKIGSQSFLAIDGYDAGIYKFIKDNLLKQDIPENNINGIDYWISTSIKTYRDEEILIAERSLDYSSHKSYDIIVMLYNGKKVVIHEEMICDYYGTRVHGMNCLFEETSTHGVKGSAFLGLKGAIGILVPRKDGSSGLFMIHTNLKTLESPIEKQVKALNGLKEKLEKRIRLHQFNLDKKDELVKIEDSDVEIVGGLLVDFPKTEAVVSQQNPTVVWNQSNNSFNNNDLPNKINDIQNNINTIQSNLQNSPILTGKCKSLTINGLVQVNKDSQIKFVKPNEFNYELTNDVFMDLVRKDNINSILSHKTFNNLNVESIIFKSVNEIQATNIATKNSSVSINGDIVFTENVSIEGPIKVGMFNNLVLEIDVIQVGNTYTDSIQFNELDIKGLLETSSVNSFPIHNNYVDVIPNQENPQKLESEEFDTIYIPGNITVENVNGEEFNNFISSLCLKNLQNYIPEKTEILGDIVVKNVAFANYLNDFKYPEDYVFSKADTFSKIMGHKIFNKKIRLAELTTTTINNINPDTVVTLSNEQQINKKFVFEDLKITESLKVENITGTVVNEFKPKPILGESNTINSNVNFKMIEVDGVVTIGNFNGTPFFETLNNVIYKDMEMAEITSAKSFPNGLTVHNNLILTSKAINKISIDSIINKETNQLINTKTLNGPVTFDNLLLLGTFGETNITKLDQESVKLTGEQYVLSTLIFEDTLVVDDIEITHNLNDIHYSEYLYTDNNLNLNDVKFEKIEVNHLIVGGKLLANNYNFNLTNFEERRLSYTKNQNVSGVFHIKESKIQTLKPNLINNYEFDDLFNLAKYSENVIGMLMSGTLAIREMYVENSINITSVNNVPMTDIMRNCIWTKEKERIKELILQDNVYFQNLEIENFNDVRFFEFINNIIYKDEKDNITISAGKVYHNGFEVTNYINTPMLNEINVENILRKEGNQSIQSNLIIEGNVLLQDKIEIGTSINDIPIEHLLTSIEVVSEDVYKINGDVVFEKLAYINDLTVGERLNSNNITDFLSNIINTSEDAKILKNITFLLPITIKGNMAVNDKVNQINFSKIKEEIVLITDDAIIESFIKFENPIIVNGQFSVDNDIMGKYVMGIDLDLWMQNAVFINNGLISGVVNFEHATVLANINAEYFNDVNLSSLIPLRSKQSIIGKLDIVELSSFNNIEVNNAVNGYKLEPEFLNTVLADTSQKIKSRIIFKNNTLVNKKLKIPGIVNDIDFKTLVLLNEPQNLTAQYQFLNKSTVTNDIEVFGLITGINMNYWAVNGIKKYWPHTQVIFSPWNLHQNLTLANVTIGNGVITNLDIRKVADNVEGMRQFKSIVEQKLMNQFKNVCIDINGLISAAKRQVYLFKYLDDYQILDLPNIKYVHQFEFKEYNYLLIYQENSCISNLYIWSDNWFSFVREIYTGDISQMITVHDGNSTFFVTRDNNQGLCKIEGTHIWKFEMDNIIPFSNIDNQLLLMDSLIPGTFYGMSEMLVVEFKLFLEFQIKPVRKWQLNTENAAFIPRGLDTGLAIRNGHFMFKLSKDDTILDNSYGNDYNSITIGNVSIHNNTFMPGRIASDLHVIKVGYPRSKTLVAVPSHEETIVKGRLDFITIYENVMDGAMYHKIPTYKPSSIKSIQFEQNGETMLVFLEDKTLLQIYEYKGIEGFKYRTTANIEGNDLIPLKLPVGKKLNNFIGVINNYKFRIMIAVMDGDQIHENKLKCNL